MSDQVDVLTVILVLVAMFILGFIITAPWAHHLRVKHKGQPHQYHTLPHTCGHEF